MEIGNSCVICTKNVGAGDYCQFCGHNNKPKDCTACHRDAGVGKFCTHCGYQVVQDTNSAQIASSQGNLNVMGGGLATQPMLMSKGGRTPGFNMNLGVHCEYPECTYPAMDRCRFNFTPKCSCDFTIKPCQKLICEIHLRDEGGMQMCVDCFEKWLQQMNMCCCFNCSIV